MSAPSVRDPGTGPAKIYTARQTFFAPRGSEHLVNENAGTTKPAIFVADDAPG